MKNTSSNTRQFFVLLARKEINFWAWASFEFLVNGSMKKSAIIEHFSWLNLRIYELTFNNYSVSLFSIQIFSIHIWNKTECKYLPYVLIFLYVLCNGSGYELFPQSAMYIALWSKKKLQKSLSRLNSRTNYWIPIFIVLPNFSIEVLFGVGSK